MSIRDDRSLTCAEVDFLEAVEGIDPSRPSALELALLVVGLDAAMGERCLARLDDHGRQLRARAEVRDRVNTVVPHAWLRLELRAELGLDEEDDELSELPELPDLEVSR